MVRVDARAAGGAWIVRVPENRLRSNPLRARVFVLATVGPEAARDCRDDPADDEVPAFERNSEGQPVVWGGPARGVIAQDHAAKALMMLTIQNESKALLLRWGGIHTLVTLAKTGNPAAQQATELLEKLALNDPKRAPKSAKHQKRA